MPQKRSFLIQLSFFLLQVDQKFATCFNTFSQHQCQWDLLMQTDLQGPSCQLFCSSEKQLKNRNAHHDVASQFYLETDHQHQLARSQASPACLLLFIRVPYLVIHPLWKVVFGFHITLLHQVDLRIAQFSPLLDLLTQRSLQRL